MAQDPDQIAAMMELLGGKGQQAPAQGMSPELVNLIHQETLAPQQQNVQLAGDIIPLRPGVLDADLSNSPKNNGAALAHLMNLLRGMHLPDDKTNVVPLRPGTPVGK